MNAPDPKEQPPKLSDSAIAAYDRIVERVYRSVDDLEEHSWPYIKSKIEEAAELELAARDMTREELDLLSAYVRRDLSELGRLAHTTGAGIAALLKFDLAALEQRVVDMLGLLADPSRVDQVELEQRLDHGPEDYLAGELAGVGTLRCLQCDAQRVLTETTLLEPCAQCGGHYFHREVNLGEG